MPDMTLTGWTFGLCTFVLVLGNLVRRFRDGPIVTAYVTLIDLNWKVIPKQAAMSVDRILSAVFGHSILSVRALLTVIAISIAINTVIYMTLGVSGHYFPKNHVEQPTQAAFISELFMLKYNFIVVSAELLGLFVAGIVNDICSFFATRVLLKRFIKRSNLLFLVADILIALLLLNLMIFSLFTIRNLMGSAALSMEKQGLDFFEVFPSFIDLLIPYVVIFRLFDQNSIGLIWDIILDPFNIYKDFRFLLLAATSSLLPTWLYLAATLFGVLAMVAGKCLGGVGTRLLEKLDKLSGESIVTKFEIIAALFVVVAVVVDLYRFFIS